MPLCLKPSFSNLFETPAKRNISIVPFSRTPALILPWTCSRDCFSRTTLSISTNDNIRDKRRPEGPPPIITTLVLI